MIKFGAAILSLARDGLESEVFAALGDRDQLNVLLRNLLAAERSQQLLTAAELVLCLDPEDKILASAQLHLAAALALTGQAETAPEHVRTAAHLDPSSVNRWVGVPDHGQHLPDVQECQICAAFTITLPRASAARNGGSACVLPDFSVTQREPRLDVAGAARGDGTLSITSSWMGHLVHASAAAMRTAAS